MKPGKSGPKCAENKAPAVTRPPHHRTAWDEALDIMGDLVRWYSIRNSKLCLGETLSMSDTNKWQTWHFSRGQMPMFVERDVYIPHIYGC